MKEELLIRNENEILERQDTKLSYEDLINKFLHYIDVSATTLETYKRALRQFYRYILQNGIQKPTRDDVISFRDNLKLTNKPNTVNLYLSSLKAFYKWLEHENMATNITRDVKSIKMSRLHLRDALSLDQVKEVLSNTKNLREKVIILLGVSLGLRVNEIANVRIEDFQSKQGKICLYVLGKGKKAKDDFVVVPQNVFDVIKEYCTEYGINDYLFVSTSNHNLGSHVTTTTLRRIVKGVYERCGINENGNACHILRHSYANISIQNNVDIREISQSMRHSSTSITEIYLHDLEEVNNKCSNTVSNILFS